MALKVDHWGGNQFNFAVSWLVGLRKSEDLLIDPPFQRGSVWTKAQKQAWIETLIDGLPKPTFFVNYHDGFGGVGGVGKGPYGDKATVIDGRQRIEAIFDFLDDKLEVRGELYSQQEETFHRRFNMVISFPVVLTSFDNEKQCLELYVRLLRCGTAHTEEDISKAQEMLREIKD